jgi:peptide/nickel transport system substrate-binding protein
MLADSRNRVFADPRIREAFLHTVPRAELAASVDAVMLDSFLVPPSSADYSDIVADESADYAQPELGVAAALLAEAGSAGAEVCVLYDPADPVRVREFELIRDAAAPAGFRVTDCSTPDWMRMLGRGGVYDAVLLSFDLTPLGPAAAGALLRSDSTTLNLNRFADPAADTLIDQLAASDDPALQAELVGRLDEKVWAASAGVPLFASPVATAVGPAVSGVSHSAFGGSVFWNAWMWQPTPHTPR